MVAVLDDDAALFIEQVCAGDGLVTPILEHDDVDNSPTPSHTHAGPFRAQATAEDSAVPTMSS